MALAMMGPAPVWSEPWQMHVTVTIKKSLVSLPIVRGPLSYFFCNIKPGDTPETSQFSRLALDWVDQFLANMRAAFAPK